ncbi:MAG: hypothetical protein COS95_00485 [Ignavibacteriales bacterium CG07_land_8_20_14_0_80_59_12]|nr:MAG: hypothetical protein COS95_00485 [Ignavibacteriales bacterium CG07_land_8_20_14_0_80_59_12]
MKNKLNDVYRLASTDAKFLALLLRDQDAALAKRNLDLSAADKRKLKVLLKKKVSVNGKELLLYVNKLLAGKKGAPRLAKGEGWPPPPPPWRAIRLRPKLPRTTPNVPPPSVEVPGPDIASVPGAPPKTPETSGGSVPGTGG